MFSLDIDPLNQRTFSETVFLSFCFYLRIVHTGSENDFYDFDTTLGSMIRIC